MGLECLECGDTAVEKGDNVWEMDEDVICPHCGAEYIVNINEDGTDVWLARKAGM